jgi:hypothetical protein
VYKLVAVRNVEVENIPGLMMASRNASGCESGDTKSTSRDEEVLEVAMGAQFRALDLLHLIGMARDRADDMEDPTRIRGRRRYTRLCEMVPSILTQHGTQFRDSVRRLRLAGDRELYVDES